MSTTENWYGECIIDLDILLKWQVICIRKGVISDETNDF